MNDASTLLDNNSVGRARSLLVLAQEELARANAVYDASVAAWESGRTVELSSPPGTPKHLAVSNNHRDRSPRRITTRSTWDRSGAITARGRTGASPSRAGCPPTSIARSRMGSPLPRPQGRVAVSRRRSTSRLSPSPQS
ncbi:AbiV family abortive infection protein [Nocardia gamkensis]|uniref:AbiV family abortive infection protein n=1 Tax=Nocardia gamkensis TaxID=352869 RepID=UPI00350E3B07